MNVVIAVRSQHEAPGLLDGSRVSVWVLIVDILEVWEGFFYRLPRFVVFSTLEVVFKNVF